MTISELSDNTVLECSQIVIDLLEEAEEKFESDEKPYTSTVWAFIYNLDILLEVYNPQFRKDLEKLYKLSTLLELKYGS